MTQLDLLSYPNHAGWKSRDTSKSAAIGVEPKAKVIRQKVLDLLRTPLSLTAWEIADRLQIDVDNIKPRLSELSDDKVKLVQPSGMKRKNPKGNDCIVWRAI